MKKLLILFLFMIIPINFGFIESSSEDRLVDHSIEFEQDVISHEVSDLIAYDNEIIPVYDSRDIEAIIMIPHIRAMLKQISIVHCVEYYMKTHFNDNENYTYNKTKDPVNLTNNNIIHPGLNLLKPPNNVCFVENNYRDKGGGISPFSIHYMYSNSKVNRQVLLHYTSGFL